MALPDYVQIAQGTAIIWGESGASGVTHTLSLDALANGAARMGAAADLGANFEDEYLVYLLVKQAQHQRQGIPSNCIYCQVTTTLYGRQR